MNKTKLMEIITVLEKVSVDLEKIQTLAFMGFDECTPVVEDDMDEVTTALCTYRRLPVISTLFDVVTDYTESINEVIERVTNLLYEDDRKGVNNGKEKNND